MNSKSLMLSSLLFLAFSLFPYFVFAQIQLLSDPYPNANSQDGAVPGYAIVEDVMYFLGFNGTKQLLLQTDGTSNGTSVVSEDLFSVIDLAADTVNKRLFLVVSGCLFKYDLAVYDIHSASFEIIGSLHNSYRTGSLKVAGNHVFYAHYGKLCSSDGTTAGTKVLLSTDQFPSIQRIISYSVFGNKILGTFKQNSAGFGLFVTDGTNDNTLLLGPTSSESWSSAPQNFIKLHQDVYFLAGNDDEVLQIWKFNLDSLSLAKINDIGIASPIQQNRLLAFQDSIYMLHQAPNRLDSIMFMKLGAAAHDIQLISTFSKGGIKGFIEIGDKMIITLQRQTGTSAVEIWSSKGQKDDARLITFLPASSSRSIGGVASLDSCMFYNYNNQLWKTDGTASGTMDIGNIEGRFSSPRNFTKYKNQLFFHGQRAISPFPDEAHEGIELFVTDGSKNGTKLFNETNTIPIHSRIAPLHLIGSKLIFWAEEETLRNPLWVSDGTISGTLRLNNDVPDGLENRFTGYGTGSLWQNDVFFPINKFGNAFQLLRTDGTLDNTSIIYESAGTMQHFGGGRTSIVYKDELYFQGPFVSSSSFYNSEGNELWKLSQPDEEPQLVKDFFPAYNSPYNPRDFTVLQDLLLFSAETSSTGRELWKTDGTSEGTLMIKDIGYSSNSGMVEMSEKGVLGDKLFFSGRSFEEGTGLWVTDGTKEGTVLVKGGSAGDILYNPTWFTEFQGQMYFITRYGAYGAELWKSDGTENGTELVKDIIPGTEGAMEPVFFEPRIIATQELLYFEANDDVVGKELWVSDGTENGTQLLKDINPGPGCSNPRNFVGAYDLVYFVANHKDGRPAIWQTDGSSEGTQLALGFPENSPFSQIGKLIPSENGIFFIAFHIEFGVSLFLLDPRGGTISIADEVDQAQLKIFPNPTSKFLNLELNQAHLSEIERITVLDLNGRQVKSIETPSDMESKTLQIKINDLPSGMYLLKVDRDGNSLSKKFMVH